MITFVKQPDKYTPVNNPVIFQLSSDNSAIQFFQVQITDAVDNVIANLRLYTTPDNRTGSFTDLSGILSNTVNYQLLPSANIIDVPANVLKAFKLTVTEKLYTNSGIADGSTTVTDLYYVWEGELNSVAFNSFDYNDYVLSTATGTTAQFLTNKPNYTKINASTSEYLYLLNNNLTGATVNVKLYNQNSQLFGNYGITNQTLDRITRLDVSPKTISDYFEIDLSDVKFYTIQISDNNALVKSKLKLYTYEKLSCNKQPVDVIFANKLGGFDSFTFFNPRETIEVTKTTITKNPYQFDDSGVYTNVINDVINEDVSTINVNSTSKYKVISDPLSDLQTVWLKELIQSPKVYVKLANGVLMPVQLTNSNYPVLQKKYSTALMRLEVELTTKSGIDLVAVPNLTANYNPPSLAYIEVDGYCYNQTDTPSFGYVQPDANGDTTIEDGI